MTATEVRRNTNASRYELVEDGSVVAIADYREQGDVLVFPHTEVAPDRRGEGLGAELVRGALDDVRATGGRIVPRCWYVADFVQDNPEYQDLLAS